MAEEKRFRNRHRLKKKELRLLEQELIGTMGSSPFSEDSEIDTARAGKWKVILDGDEVIGVFLDEKLFPTVRGLIGCAPTEGFVTVDMGAIEFVVNGADIMAPGIVEADENIAVGDPVWVRDEKNGKPIAIGLALMDGTEMRRSNRGKAVENLHYVGDEIWNLGHG